MLTFDAKELADYAQRIFIAAGADAEHARIVVDHLIESNLVGHDSHGVMLIAAYVRQMKDGTIQPNHHPRIAVDRGVAVTVDGCWTFGHVASRFATDLAIARGRQNGLCLIGVVRCNHIGRLGDYAARAAHEGIVLFVTYGFPGGLVTAHGGRQGVLGTNPIAIGFPAGEESDFLLDVATSSVAGGKIQVARAKGERIPEGLLLDRNGEPTTDPDDFYNGGVLLPFGGHKGYGLGIVSLLLSQILVGSADYEDNGRKASAFFLAIDSSVFRPRSVVESEADQVFQRITSTPPATGFDAVRIPGQPELLNRERRLREGIPVPEAIWQEIQEAAESVGVTLPRR